MMRHETAKNGQSETGKLVLLTEDKKLGRLEKLEKMADDGAEASLEIKTKVDLDHACKRVRRYSFNVVNNIWKIGKELSRMDASEVWKEEGFQKFSDYCFANLDLSQRSVNRYKEIYSRFPESFAQKSTSVVINNLLSMPKKLREEAMHEIEERVDKGEHANEVSKELKEKYIEINAKSKEFSQEDLAEDEDEELVDSAPSVNEKDEELVSFADGNTVLSYDTSEARLAFAGGVQFQMHLKEIPVDKETDRFEEVKKGEVSKMAKSQWECDLYGSLKINEDFAIGSKICLIDGKISNKVYIYKLKD